MKKINLVYIVIDGARNYPSPWNDKELGGTAGRPEIFDDFIKEGVWFQNAVCSAPSTIMSFSSTFTGFPAGFLARNFVDFKFDDNKFNSLVSILKSAGYKIYTIMFYAYGRKCFKNMLFPIDDKYWPKNISADKDWSADTIMNIFENVIKEKDISPPFFLLVHYNIRWERSISDKVRKILEYLKLIGVYDNSILILCSDHGLPDPKRKLPKELLRDQGHDLIVTDDNILFPLCIKYPGSPVKTVRSVVSNLDIMPTVLDLLKLPYSNHFNIPLRGKSLVPLIEGSIDRWDESRMILTECRYISQPNRVISLRSDKYKYVYLYDKFDGQKEHFFDLSKDPLELVNLIDDGASIISEKIKKFHKELKRYEEELFQFQHEYLLSEFSSQFNRLFPYGVTSIKNILILGSNDVQITKALIYGSINNISRKVLIDVVSFGLFKRKEEASLLRNELILEEQESFPKAQIEAWIKSSVHKGYDMIWCVVSDTNRYLFLRSLKNFSKKNSKNVIFINYNMEVSKSLKKRKVPFGSKPSIPLIIRKIYKWLGYHYYRRYWYYDDIKLAMNRRIPFLNLKTYRKE